MIRTSFATFGAAALLLGASACAESKTTGLAPQDLDPDAPGDAGQDPTESDASTDEEGGDRDAGDEGQSADGGDEGEDLDAGSEPMDGAADPEPDAAVEADAGSDDDAGGTDAGDESPDASTEEPAPEPALFARYTFDENTGTTAADSAGDFGPAELLNGAGFTAGVDGSALALAGGEQYATLPANILSGCNDITVALWMKLGSIAPWARILDIDGGVDGFLFFTPSQYFSEFDGPYLHFNIWHAHGDQGVSAAYPAGVELVNQWHHVAFTLSNGTGHLYFDGVEIGSKAMLSKPSDVTLGAGARAWIGRSLFVSDPYLEAAIDDLRVSCTALSAEQVAELVP